MRSLKVLAAVVGIIFCFSLFGGCMPMLAKGGTTPANKAGEGENSETVDEPEPVYKITITKPTPATPEVPAPAKPKEKWEPKPMFPEAEKNSAPQQPPAKKQPQQPPAITNPPLSEPTSTPYVDAAARQAADEAAAIALQARETAENAAKLADETAKVVIATATVGQQTGASNGNTSTAATKPAFAAPTVSTDCAKNTAKELLFKNNHSLAVFLRIDGKYTTRWVKPGETLFVCLPAETTKHVVEAFAGEGGVVSQVAMKDPSLSIWDTDNYTGARKGPYLALGSNNFRSYIPPTQPTKK